MLSGEEIIYISSDWFRENKTSTHHIAEELAKHNRLLYVEAAGMRAPQASRRDLRKILSKIGKFFAKPTRVMDNLYLYSPLILPFHQYGLARWLNQALLARPIKRAALEVGFREPILWIFMPHFSSLVHSLRNKGVVYYVTDEYTATPHVKSSVIQHMEEQILERAHVVFTVSDELRENKSRLNPNVYLSPHGVDVEFFKGAVDASTPVPDDIAAIRRPIAGFFGLIENYIDLELIDHLASTLQDVSFVLLGRVAQDVSRLSVHANVHFLGPRAYTSLAGYLKAFDVCLLLYRQGAFSKNANPKKLREYLAGGKPIVSVRIPEVERYADLVYIADSYEEFARLVRRAIDHDPAELKTRRLAAMGSESWAAKVEWISTTISRHLPSVRCNPSQSVGSTNTRATGRDTGRRP
jgi:glycosyltransferase involved in cell wall biosynthesis